MKFRDIIRNGSRLGRERLPYSLLEQKLTDDNDRKLFELAYEYGKLSAPFHNGEMSKLNKTTRPAIEAEKKMDEFVDKVFRPREVTLDNLERNVFYAFKTKKDGLIFLHVSEQGLISLTNGNNFNADDMEKIDEMDSVDGLGDYQHGLVNILLGHNLKKNKAYKQAVKISKEGL